MDYQTNTLCLDQDPPRLVYPTSTYHLMTSLEQPSADFISRQVANPAFPVPIHPLDTFSSPESDMSNLSTSSSNPESPISPLPAAAAHLELGYHNPYDKMNFLRQGHDLLAAPEIDQQNIWIANKQEALQQEQAAGCLPFIDANGAMSAMAQASYFNSATHGLGLTDSYPNFDIPLPTSAAVYGSFAASHYDGIQTTIPEEFAPPASLYAEHEPAIHPPSHYDTPSSIYAGLPDHSSSAHESDGSLDPRNVVANGMGETHASMNVFATADVGEGYDVGEATKDAEGEDEEVTEEMSGAVDAMEARETRSRTRRRFGHDESDSGMGDDGEAEDEDDADSLSSYSPSNAGDSPYSSPKKLRQNHILPTPAPGLTKKSRGRHVPTQGERGKKNGRAFVCNVDGCGKCFQRGEHLKRHVRSIHTDEKPHECLYPNCGKTFSRHDNLAQHMKIHGKSFASKEGNRRRRH